MRTDRAGVSNFGTVFLYPGDSLLLKQKMDVFDRNAMLWEMHKTEKYILGIWLKCNVKTFFLLLAY